MGKRVYRVKVRENMGVGETVRAIEKMVGFGSGEVEDVVKAYFMNWERRQRTKMESNKRSHS